MLGVGLGLQYPRGLIGGVFVGLFNQVTNPALGLSLRRLDTNYNGDSVHVRRANNDIGQIPFSGNETDIASLLAFANGTSVFGTDWFDQSGLGRHVSQSSASSQPLIVDNGFLNTENGKPAFKFDGIDDHLIYAGEILNQGSFLSFSVANNLKASGNSRIFDQSRLNGGSFLTIFNGATTMFGITSIGNLFINDPVVYTGQTLYTGQILSEKSKIKINGELTAESFGSFTMSGDTEIDFIVGNNSPVSTDTLEGNLSELVIYTNDNDANIETVENNINNFYNIYA